MMPRATFVVLDPRGVTKGGKLYAKGETFVATLKGVHLNRWLGQGRVQRVIGRPTCQTCELWSRDEDAEGGHLCWRSGRYHAGIDASETARTGAWGFGGKTIRTGPEFGCIYHIPRLEVRREK